MGLTAAPAAFTADPVVVPGSAHKFSRSITTKYGDQPLTLRLTGAGMRTKLIFNVYAIGSYLQDTSTARTPEDVARAETARALYLVMERTVESADFIDAFKTAVGKTYPVEKFAAEFNQLTTAIGSRAAQKGDHVTLFYMPGAGLRIQIVGKVDVTIQNPAFAQALWEVFLGPKPIDEDLKKSLVNLIGR
jgi:hypothetical protein